LKNSLCVFPYFGQANAYKHGGRTDEAIALYNTCLATRTKLLDPDHPDIAKTFNNLANALFQLKNYGAASTMYQKSLDATIAFYGNTHPKVAASLNNLANVAKKNGAIEQALDFYQQSLLIRRKTLGDDHPDVASSHFNLGDLNFVCGNFAGALQNFYKALATREALRLDGDVIWTKSHIGDTLVELGQYEKAILILNETVESRKKLYSSAAASTHHHVLSNSRNLLSVAIAHQKLGALMLSKNITENVIALLKGDGGAAGADSEQTQRLKWSSNRSVAVKAFLHMSFLIRELGQGGEEETKEALRYSQQAKAMAKKYCRKEVEEQYVNLASKQCEACEAMLERTR
jgi:tetratricopeptide (TPR) repeat protein